MLRRVLIDFKLNNIIILYGSKLKNTYVHLLSVKMTAWTIFRNVQAIFFLKLFAIKHSFGNINTKCTIGAFSLVQPTSINIVFDM